MRKVSVFTVGIMVVVAVLLSAGATAESEEKPSMDVSEQIILGLLYQPTTAAVDSYYGEHRQYWRQKVLSMQKLSESPYYEVIIQVETFHGAHNPPYGLETMTFYIGPLDKVQLVDFNHIDEPD